MYSDEVKERFEQKFYVTPSCWIWTASRNQKGYGRMTIRGSGIMAHRISHEIYIGSIPNGLIVCHSCDNPSCVNPAHLWLGTHQDNSDDKISKGRQAAPAPRVGQDHPLARLSAEDVLAIRSSSRPIPEIAAQYGISNSHAANIKERRCWRHVNADGTEVASVDGRARAPRLSREAIEMVRQDPRFQPAIALEFGISQTVVSRIKLGKGCYAPGLGA